MKLSPSQSLLLLTLLASALLAGGLAWASLQMKGINRAMEQEVRLGRFVTQLQVVQNEVAAARQLLNPAATGENGVTAPLIVARNRLQFADGVLRGLESQVTTPVFNKIERQSLAELLAMSGNLARNKQVPVGAGIPDERLVRFQKTLGRFAAHLGRKGLVEAEGNTRLRARFRRDMAVFASGGIALLALLSAYLAVGWRQQYARLRQWLQATATGPSHRQDIALPGGALHALANDLDNLGRRVEQLQESALQHVLAVEEAAAKLVGVSERWVESLSAGERQEALSPPQPEQFEKVIQGLQALAGALQAASDRLRVMPQIIGDGLPERRHSPPGRTELAPRLAMAGEKIEQLLLLCLNLRLSLLHGQVDPSHFAAVADQLDPVCAEGIDLAQEIAAVGASLRDTTVSSEVVRETGSGEDARQILHTLRDGLARQAQAAGAMAGICARLRAQRRADQGEGARIKEATSREAEIHAIVGDLQQRLHKLRTAGAR